MNSHPDGMTRIECRVDGDPRLIAGAGMIAAHVARRAGLSNAAASDLADATVRICRAVLESTEETGSRTIRLSASELTNSIEVSVEALVQPGARRLSPEQSRDLADRVRQMPNSAADGVNVEFQEGLPRVTLVRNGCATKHPFAV